jgi:archaellum component FlaC
MCQESTAVIKFNERAIEQLDQDYKDVRTFSSCDSNVNFFKSSLKKTLNNNLDSVKTSVQDVEEALKRLKSAFLGE